jgi:starvation-inducible outer membrane lipoprotein
LIACAPATLFPPEILKQVDRTVRFEQVLRHAAEYRGRVMEFGGQILGSVVEGEEVQLLVRELPIQTTPIYGPVDRGGPRGMFFVSYPGKIGVQDLQHGNMVIVIGVMLGPVVKNLTGVPVGRPMLSAQCLHVWRTQGRQISDFPYGQNFTPLVQSTYCTNGQNTILTVT